MGSMVCTLLLLGVGAGIWMGQDAIRHKAAASKPADDGRLEAQTNNDIAGVP